MGNYMETCIQRKELEEKIQVHQETMEQEKQESQKTTDNYCVDNDRTRVKLVLTKDELQWLLSQLKNKQGKRLEDVLGAIGKSRMRAKRVAAGWKPSLESIMETPHIHNEMNRS